MESNGVNEQDLELWFADKDVDVYLFRVNRRPLAGEGAHRLFDDQMHSDVAMHLRAVLQLSDSVVHGRRHKRIWRVGNLTSGPNDEWVTGRLGAQSGGPRMEFGWNKDERNWEPEVRAQEHSVVTPFAFLREGRVLAVMRHPEINENAAAAVLTHLLNDGERTSGVHGTDWSVDPILSEEDFDQWVNSVDRVVKVKFVFKRPNPDRADDLEILMGRLDALDAEYIAEEVKAKDPQLGLDKDGLNQDAHLKQLKSAAVRSWAFITGLGYRKNQRVPFSQDSAIARERATSVGRSWEDAETATLQAAIRGKEKRLS
jgi:hypothetical protein